MPNKPFITAATFESVETSCFARWFDVNFLCALLVSFSLVAGVLVLRIEMLPVYDDYELDLPQLTVSALSLNAVLSLAVLPIVVVTKEFLVSGRLRKNIDSVVTVACLVLGLVVAWAVVSPIFFYDDSLYS